MRCTGWPPGKPPRLTLSRKLRGWTSHRYSWRMHSFRTIFRPLTMILNGLGYQPISLTISTICRRMVRMFNNIFSQGDYSIYMLYIHQPQRSRGDDQLLLRRFRSLSFCVHKNKSPERLTKAKAPLACSPRPDMSKQTGAKRSKTQLSRRDCCVLLERLDVRDDSPKRKSVRCGDTTPNAIGERFAVHNVNGCNLQTLNLPAIISLSQDPPLCCHSMGCFRILWFRTAVTVASIIIL